MNWETKEKLSDAKNALFSLNEMYADDDGAEINYIEEKIELMDRWNNIYDSMDDAGKEKMNALLDEFVNDPYSYLKRSFRHQHRFEADYYREKYDDMKTTYSYGIGICW